MDSLHSPLYIDIKYLILGGYYVIYYDTNIIHSFNKSNENEFHFDGKAYYKSKTGIPKMKKYNSKAVKISENEYRNAWKQYKERFF